MKMTWKVHKDMKIGFKEWEENSEDIQEALFQPKVEMTANKEKNLINRGIF